MTLKELEAKLNSDDKLKNIYSIGKIMEERLCLLFENDFWEVCSCERGTKIPIKKFTTEQEACEFFLSNINFISSL